MQTFLIELTNNKAYKLLQELEELHLIRVIKKNAEPVQPQSLADRFAGKLHLSDEQYNNFQQHIVNSRNEWQRDI